MQKKKAKSRTCRHRKKDAEGLARKELTEEEKRRLDDYQRRLQRKPAKFKSTPNDSPEPGVALEEPDDPLSPARVAEALGTGDAGLQDHLLNQVVYTFRGTLSATGADNDRIVKAINNTLAILTNMQPKDQTEAMLAIQMIGAHNTAMHAMQRAMLGDQTFAGRKAAVEQAAKMLRAFAMQVTTLKRYRAADQLKMVVGRVDVSGNGQAIVGTVNQTGRKAKQQNDT